jgi:copper homeostasis protein
MRYEVCVTSVDGVRSALSAGADRVELCADLSVGGVTPSSDTVAAAVEAAGRLPVHVLIRPRAGDFVYSRDEVAAMLRSIDTARRLGAAGLVLGALTPAGQVDLPTCQLLVAAARPASVTFHRAFDETADPLAALSSVLALGADRLLTSGGAATALDGADVIAELVRRSSGQLIVMAGGGVTPATARAIVTRTGVPELHFSARPRPDLSSAPIAAPSVGPSASTTGPSYTSSPTSPTSSLTERIRATMRAAAAD